MMPVKLTNITDEAHQRHILLFEESEIVLTLRFYPTVEMWCFDAEYKENILNGYKLSTGVLHMRSRNMPFDFFVVDASSSGLDPFKLDDFSTGRCELYMFDSDDMEAVRNAPVPI